MKTFKKITAILLAVVLTAAVPFAVSAAPSDNMLCDVDGNKVINASDARAILRSSARLEAELPLLLADADNDYRVTSADARLALRKSAKLQNLLYGYDAEGMPNVLDTLRSGAYSLVISYEGFTMTVYVNNGSFYMPADPFFSELDSDGMIGRFLTDMGLLFTGGSIYLLFTDAVGFMAPAGTKCYMAFTDESMGDMGGSEADMAEIEYLTNMFVFPSDESYAYSGPAEIDGKSYELFSFFGSDYTRELYMGYNGQLKYISYTVDSDTVSTPISYIGEDVSGGSFSVAGREFIDFSGMLG